MGIQIYNYQTISHTLSSLHTSFGSHPYQTLASTPKPSTTARKSQTISAHHLYIDWVVDRAASFRRVPPRPAQYARAPVNPARAH